ncbi:MAG: ABC transporter ATP-binding protein [Chloroflexaceae bacterium]|jgi:branched-chain amino acid transport system ATP-binding protein|nr:ABC transporter ATP-binding protein [Chloroflexaceae bacterium]
MHALSIDNVSKNYGGLQVLYHLSLTIGAGERVAIIGPNGAGKTTFLSIISGVQQTSSGRIHMFGQDVTRLPADHRTHLGLGCSFQSNRLFFGLSVRENVLLALQGVRPARFRLFGGHDGDGATQAEARRLLESVDLWPKANEPVGALAYGEQRKLEIVLGLASNPRLLVLDEPTAGLALAEVPPFIAAIKNLAAHTTVLFTSHDMDVVFGLAQRLVVLSFGQIIADGPPDAIRNDPRVREIYLGAEV